MCGINGIFAYHYAANPIDRVELRRTRDHMAARGPDGVGEWISADERVAFGHRRLAIIDLSEAGMQPMASADGKLVITYNGELYNFRALRRELEAKGHLFRSQSDTEVLLHLYAEKGEAMVHDLRGMFAFALWDADRQRLFMARDPYGIKPLYYADDGWTLRFASQVKALLAGGRTSHDPEPAGQVGFYLWGSVPDPFTTHREIRALPAGCAAIVDRIGFHAPKRYHSIAAVCAEASAPGELRRGAGDGLADIRSALLDSVRHHLVADVPVGAFLSAGIDSGTLVGLMREVGHADIQTVTLAFDELRSTYDDEAPLAAEVARAFGTRHTTRRITEGEFRADLPRILEAMDQPSIDGINTWFVSKSAKELGLKVAISGLGGDELFGGYSSFRDIPLWRSWAAIPSRIPLLGRLLRVGAVTGGLNSTFISPKAAGMLEYGGTVPGAYLLRRGVFMPWELDKILDRETARVGLQRLRPLALVASSLVPEPRSDFAKVAALEASLYMRNQLLRDTDWASMAHGLEVRVPLVDSRLLEAVAPVLLRSGAQKGKKALAAASRVPLPEAVVTRAKTGFTTPIASWLQRMPGQRYQEVPMLAAANCRWARRWAYCIGASESSVPMLRLAA
jgi:asparagine synthase (glutamine-hydrolysing)